MKQNFNILVVDDDLNNIQVGINFLKQNENYRLVFATSGEQALERVKEKNFDLVLLDIIMPHMDGYEVCKRLKKDPETRQIPVIFLTAKHYEDAVIEGFAVGGADYITKPFNAPELHARVKTHLELHHHYKKEIAKLHEVLACSQRAETIKFMAGGIAHDCKNFMSSIPGSIYLIQNTLSDQGIPNDDYQGMINGMSAAVDNVSKLLTKLTNLSSRNMVTCEVVDMNEVVYDLNKMFKVYSQNDIKLSVTFLSQPALAYADKLHIEQVILNILVNARHAILSHPDRAEHGHIQVTIDITDGRRHKDLSDEKAYLNIKIEDNGVGMTPEIAEKIFTPYFSTRKNEGGTGLGLAVSLSIVQSHSGTIDVNSTAGKGTVFHIYFPYYKPDDDQSVPGYCAEHCPSNTPNAGDKIKF